MNKKKVTPPIALNIPANIPPKSVGDYIAKQIEDEYDFALAIATTSSITASAIRVDKEKMRLSKFILQLGLSAEPIKCTWEWERKK